MGCGSTWEIRPETATVIVDALASIVFDENAAFLDAPELRLPVYPTRSEAGRLSIQLA